MAYLNDSFGRWVTTNLPPTMWWRMAQPVGGTSYDEMGSSVTMAGGGGIANESLVSGKSPGMYGHRHTADAFITPSSITPSRNFTIAAWLKYEAEPQQYATVLAYERTSAGWYLSARPFNGDATYMTRTGVGNIGGTGGPKCSADTNWHMWTWLVNSSGASVQFYKDTTFGTGGGDLWDISANGSGNCRIVVGSPGNTGAAISVGDVMYWNSCLTTTQMTNLYNASALRSAYSDLGSSSGVVV